MRLPEVRNKILEKISRFDFLIDGQENEEDAGPVQLMFTDNSILEIDLIPDGESVEYKWKGKGEVEEEDKKTDWFRIDLTDKEPFSQLQKMKILDYDQLLFGTVEERLESFVVAGLGFLFENGMSLVYYNAGDFAKVYVNEMPPAFDGQFKLVWKSRKFKDI
jgi:hypothetical protein